MHVFLKCPLDFTSCDHFFLTRFKRLNLAERTPASLPVTTVTNTLPTTSRELFMNLPEVSDNLRVGARGSLLLAI